MSERRRELVDNVAQAAIVVCALEAQLATARLHRDQHIAALRDDGVPWRQIPREVGQVLAERYDHGTRGVSLGNVRLAVRKLNA